jgi:hypothetical protein
MKKAFFIMVSALSVIALVGGCSVSQRSLDDAQRRIDALKAKGVPDSSLSTALVYLYQAKDANQRGNKGLAHLSADSMRILIAQAEALYSENLIKLRPTVDSLIFVINKAKSELTGLQVKKLDSAMKVIESFSQKNWIYQVEAISKAVVADMLPQLKFNEARARELRGRIPGEWVCTNKTKNDENKAINSVEKKVFTFNKDGTANLVETKKGQSSQVLKEDYEFDSHGTYDFLGDTVMIFIKRFAAVKQNFENQVDKNGKKVWELKKEPTYDSIITDGSQDRWIPFTEMQTDFVQEKKF